MDGGGRKKKTSTTIHRLFLSVFCISHHFPLPSLLPLPSGGLNRQYDDAAVGTKEKGRRRLRGPHTLISFEPNCPVPLYPVPCLQPMHPRSPQKNSIKDFVLFSSNPHVNVNELLNFLSSDHQLQFSINFLNFQKVNSPNWRSLINNHRNNNPMVAIRLNSFCQN